MPQLTIDVAARYPRSDFRVPPGRLLVELKTAAGAAAHATIRTKEQLLAALARVIPGLETRKMRNAHAALQRAQYEEAMKKAEAQRKGQARAEAAGGGGKGKKR
jgi:hypothetical protein